MSNISNIVFLSETWSPPNDLNIFESFANSSKKQFIFNSDIDYIVSKGRPFLPFDVYMPFDDSNNRFESKSKFELVLSLISSIIEEFYKRKIVTVITGDFNADFNRSNIFDVILKNFTKENNYVIINNLNPINPPTYISPITKSIIEITANIDHFILCQNSFPSFLINPSFTIFNDPSNLSDHKAINFSFQIDLRDVNVSIKPSIPIKKINFENEQVRNHFFDKVESKLKRKFDFIIRNNFELSVLDQKSIHNLYNDFCNCYVESQDETVKFLESIGPQTISNRII